MDSHDSGQLSETAAEIYQRFFVPALFAGWPDPVLDAAKVVAGDRVLDVACGSGVLAGAAAIRAGDQERVSGVDINPGMLDVARALYPKIDWQQGAAEALPFEANHFDRVVSQFGLMFFEDRIRAISEMRRVCRPGGRVCVAVWGRLQDTPGYLAVAQLLHELFGAERARSIEVPYVLGERDELAGLFDRAGVRDYRIDTLTGQVRFDSIDAWVYTDIKGWTLADQLSESEYLRFRDHAHRALVAFQLEDGSVCFDAPAHLVSFSPDE